MKKQRIFGAFLALGLLGLVAGGGKAEANKNKLTLLSLDSNVYEDNTVYTNYLVAGFSKKVEGGKNFCLTYDKEGKTCTTHKVAVKNKQAVFYIKETAGSYRIRKIQFEKDGKTQSISVEKARKQNDTVDESFSVSPSEEALQSSRRRVSELLNYMVPSKAGKGAEKLEAALLSKAVSKAAAKGKYVVVIDPGHGGSDTGCNRTYDGVKYKESELTLQIAKACKMNLEKTGKVTVFLTRDKDVYPSFTQRAQLAADKNAAFLVSFHLNATGEIEAKATGAEAIYQNGNYNATVGAWSKELAQIMVGKLAGLGLKNRGIYFKNNASGKYPDGSITDYFAINRMSKQLGFPGIILEHCFLNNSSDFNKYLITEDKTAMLGKADAEGIMQYLSMEHAVEKPAVPTGVKPSGMTKLRVKVAFSYSGKEQPTGFELFRADSLNGTYQKVADGKASAKYMIDTTGVAGNTYFYKVRAAKKNQNGYSYGDFSKVVSYAVLEVPIVNGCDEAEGGVELSWEAVKGATGYEIVRSDSPDGTFRSFATVAECRAADPTKDGKQWVYKIRALRKLSDRTAYSKYSALKMTGTRLLMAEREEGNKIALFWEKQSEVSGYRLYRREDNGEEVLLKELSQNDSSYVDTGVLLTTEYSYRLTSFIRRGGKTAESCGSTKTVTAGVAAPKITESGKDAKKQVTLGWEAVKGATGYEVYGLKTTEEKLSSKNRLATVAGDKTVYTGKAKAGVIFYSVRAVKKGAENTSYSQDNELVLAGTNLRFIQSYGEKKLRIVWEKEEGITGYKLYRSEKKSGNYKLLKTLSAGETSYLSGGCTPGVTYYYRVQTYYKETVDGETRTVWSKSKAFLSRKAGLKPLIKEAQKGQDGCWTIRWKKLAGVEAYQLYRSSKENGTYKRVKTLTKLSYKDPDSKKKQYYYKVRGRYLQEGYTGYSAYSEIVSNGKAAVKLTVPKLSHQINEAGQGLLSWQKVENAQGYQIFRSTTGQEDDFSKLAQVTAEEGATYVDREAETGTVYYYRVRAYCKDIKTVYSGFSNICFSAVTAGIVSLTEENGARVTWNPVKGAFVYELFRKKSTDQSWTSLGTMAGTSYEDKELSEGETYEYGLTIGDGTYMGELLTLGSIKTRQITVLTPIMGKAEATKEQMVRYFNRVKKPFPTLYAEAAYGGVTCIEDFVQIIIEEATAEGVRPDLVAAQIFKETGYLQFGGDVQIEQCNFAGIGAVGGGAKGASFSDVRTGIRAQVQHLKAYAVENPVLVYECVDPRFAGVKKGKAPYIEWLGISENPYGTGWATAKNYGYDLVANLTVMKKLSV